MYQAVLVHVEIRDAVAELLQETAGLENARMLDARRYDMATASFVRQRGPFEGQIIRF